MDDVSDTVESLLVSHGWGQRAMEAEALKQDLEERLSIPLPMWLLVAMESPRELIDYVEEALLHHPDLVG